MEVKLNDLPDLPFEKILSYLILEDLLKSRAVSRRWCKMIDGFRTKSLCFSGCQSGFMLGKTRLVSGGFDCQFISSPRLESFFCTFGPSILASLKHLRLCELYLNFGKMTALDQALCSFKQLQELDIIDCGYLNDLQLELQLPTIHVLRLEYLNGVRKLALYAPKLRRMTVLNCPSSLRLDVVHGESVEWLVTDQFEPTTMKKLKNLQYLYLAGYVDYRQYSGIDSIRFLISFEQLKEVHLSDCDGVREFFERKKRNRPKLKIYLCGLLLNGPDDYNQTDEGNKKMNGYLDKKVFAHLAENQSRLAAEMPFCESLPYDAVERVSAETEMNIVKRMTGLSEIRIDRPVQNVQRFLGLLKNFRNIVKLEFYADQPQELFDRLSDYCGVQQLTMRGALSDLRFLPKLKRLTQLDLNFSIDLQTIRKVLELASLTRFEFRFYNKEVTVEIERSNYFTLFIGGKNTDFDDLNALIRYIQLTIGNSLFAIANDCLQNR